MRAETLYIVSMFVDLVPNRNSRPAVLLRESYREGDKVKLQVKSRDKKTPEDAPVLWEQEFRVGMTGGKLRLE